MSETAIPRSDHPWRQYKNRLTTNGQATEVSSLKPLRVFLEEIVTNWSHVDVPTRVRGHFDRYTLIELPDNVAADYLISMLRRYNRNYVEPSEYEKEVLNEVGEESSY